MPLHVVKPTPRPPEKRASDRVRNAPKPAQLLQCHRCAGREVIDTRIGVEFVNGKTRGGTKQVLCALCFSKGERVVLA